jgi:hypothetical protein
MNTALLQEARKQLVASVYVARKLRSCFFFCIIFVVPLDCMMAMELNAMRTVVSTACIIQYATDDALDFLDILRGEFWQDIYG